MRLSMYLLAIIYLIEYYLDIKEENLAFCNNIDGLWGHYAKWNTSDKEKPIFLYISLKAKSAREGEIMVARILGSEGAGKVGWCYSKDTNF